MCFQKDMGGERFLYAGFGDPYIPEYVCVCVCVISHICMGGRKRAENAVHMFVNVF